jgi:Ca2+-binding RTX toxin-like protein
MDNYALKVAFALVLALPAALVFAGVALAETKACSGRPICAGTAYNDVLVGDAAANTLYGFGSNDKLYGRGGNDTLSGGGGSDLLSGGPGGDERFATESLGAPGRDVV